MPGRAVFQVIVGPSMENPWHPEPYDPASETARATVSAWHTARISADIERFANGVLSLGID